MNNLPPRYRWAAPGDVNAFFGLALDNLANLVQLVALLAAFYQFPASFAFQYLIPGSAIGVIVGDLLFTWMAFRLARRSGRTDVTAMPLGLDTPSLFGMIYFVLGPAYLTSLHAGLTPDAAARHTWHIGIWAIVASGLFKAVCSCGSSWARRIVPRAGLLGSLAAIALVLITFGPLLKIVQYPVAGWVALAVVLTTLVARVRLPLGIPGALAALLVGGTIYYAMLWTGTLGHVSTDAAIDAHAALWPTGWLAALRLEWVADWPAAAHYLPIVIPFALATVVGGIDCTESAAAAGDEYPTGWIIFGEALATLTAGLCGGVIQTTPYIGHPAYKAMGGRAAYTLATAAFIGSAGVIGYFGYLYQAIPLPAILPILIFIGLEIAAQSFHATPGRHYPAVAFACLPAMSVLVLSQIEAVKGDPALHAVNWDHLQAPLAETLQTLQLLASGFIITSLLWASALAALIDRLFLRAATFLAVAGICSLFGLIHAPTSDGQLFVPWNLPHLSAAAAGQTPLYLAAGYFAAAALLAMWGLFTSEACRQEAVGRKQ